MARPKAELHLDIEGSLESEMMVALAARNGITLPYASVEDVQGAYASTRLQDFLDIYYAGAAVLQTRADFRDLAAAYFDRAAANNVDHAEILFDPQTHTDCGITFETVIERLLDAMADAESRHGLTSKLILCFLRHLDEDAAFKTLRRAKPWLDRIAGEGLDSSKVGHPPKKFVRVFAAARAKGLTLVAHAGEEGPPDYVMQALDVLGINRLDHGNRSLEDSALTLRLVESGITLTVCPLSNLKLGVVENFADHPIERMLRAGPRATINSDDPAYFGGYVGGNYRAVTAARGLGKDDLVALARNSFLGSFLPEMEIAAYLARIAGVCGRAGLSEMGTRS